jgi:hypothetical protein
MNNLKKIIYEDLIKLADCNLDEISNEEMPINILEIIVESF